MTSIPSPIYESDTETIWAFEGPLLRSKHFLVLQHTQDATFIVDSGFGKSEVVEVARKVGRETIGLYLTHGHFDHVGGASYVSQELRCPVRLQEADLITMKTSNFLLKVLGYSVRMQTPLVTAVDASYADAHVSFLSCPGHTPGSVLIKSGNLLFSGDSIYADRVDAVVLPQQDNGILRQSLLSNISAITSSTLIFPGHGGSVSGAVLLERNRELAAFLNLENPDE